MPDKTYGPKVYRKQGGEEFVVADGGQITVESGGDIVVDGDSLAAAIAIVAAIPTTDQEDSSTIWNDGGVLKISTAG